MTKDAAWYRNYRANQSAPARERRLGRERERDKRRAGTPERQATAARYRASPKGKAARERKLEEERRKRAERNARPEVMAAKAAKRAESAQRAKEQRRRYRQRPEVKAKSNEAKRRHRQTATKKAARRRAQARTVLKDVLLKFDVFDTQPNCYLCGTPIYTLLGADIDHVRPRSRGGVDIRENMRLAHPVCNVVKSNRCLHELIGLPGHPLGACKLAIAGLIEILPEWCCCDADGDNGDERLTLS